jgi:hypothetical protein
VASTDLLVSVASTDVPERGPVKALPGGEYPLPRESDRESQVTQIDQARLEQFFGQAAGDMAAAISGLLVHIGDRLGLYSLTARQLARGVYQNVIATYNSDPTFAKSTSSPPQTLTVNRR